MVYCYEILKKKGKFGSIWLASTNPKALSRRDLVSVNISRTCSDLESYIHPASSVQHSSSPLSLRLSAQLLHGIVLVSRKQHNFLFDEVKSLWRKLSTWHSVETDATTLTPRRVNVTFDDRMLFDVEPNFGNMKEFLMSPRVLSDYELYFLSSPRLSAAEGSVPRPLALPTAEHEELPYTVPRERVTLEEMPLSGSEIEISAPDIPPLDLDDFEAPFLPPQPSAFMPPAPYPLVTPTITRDEMEEIAVPPLTPAAKIEVREPSHPIKRPAPPAGDDVTDVPDAQTPVSTKRRCVRALELYQLQLEEIPTMPPRRRQHRKMGLVIDHNTQLSSDAVDRQISLAAFNLTRPVAIPCVEPSVDELFRTPGSRILKDVLKKPWKNIRTMAVPDDTATPGSYCAGYEESPAPSTTQSPDVVMQEDADVTRRTEREEMEFLEVEMPRRVSDLPELSSPISGVALREVITSPEISMIHPSDVQAESTRYLTDPVEADELDSFNKHFEKMLRLQAELLRMIESRFGLSRNEPPSQKVIEPSLEKVMELLSCSEEITFKKLVPPNQYKRSFAAKTFMQLLDMHKQRFITLNQEDEQFGEIVVKKIPQNS